jgi:cation transport regulator ChaC
MTLHFGYGSNLWFEQMNKRCPENIRKGKGVLQDWRWIIADRPGSGAANILESQGDFVEGYVFELSEIDERTLDEKEGVNNPGRYIKKYLEIEMNDEVVPNVMTYVDENNTNNAIDKQLSNVNNKQIRCTVGCECTYASRINKGIKDSGLSDKYIQKYIRKFINE